MSTTDSRIITQAERKNQAARLSGQPAEVISAPGCIKCQELEEQIQRFRAIVRRSIPAPQDSDAVSELLMAE